MFNGVDTVNTQDPRPVITRPSAPLVACGCNDKPRQKLVEKSPIQQVFSFKATTDKAYALTQLCCTYYNILHIPPDHTSCLIFYGSSEQTSLEGARRAA